MSDWENDGVPCPCDDCVMDCDAWDSQFCCIYCHWYYGDDPPCEDCNPMDI